VRVLDEKKQHEERERLMEGGASEKRLPRAF